MQLEEPKDDEARAVKPIVDAARAVKPIFSRKSSSIIKLVNDGLVGDIRTNCCRNASTEKDCCCCEETVCCVVACCPLIWLSYLVCAKDVCAEASIKLDDRSGSVNVNYWNWYLPCFWYCRSFTYDSIADIGYYKTKVSQTLSSSIYKQYDLHNVVIRTKNGTECEINRKWFSTGSEGTQSWSVRNIENPMDVAQGRISSLEVALGIHFFLFGRETEMGSPVLNSKYYSSSGKYSLSPSDYDALCFKTSNYEFDVDTT